MAGKLTIADYVILFFVLAFSLGIGLFFAVKERKKTTRKDYLLGNRQLGVFPVCLSLFVTYMSAIGMIGCPSEMYYYGIMFWYFFASRSFCYVVGLFTLIPLLYPLKLTSMYEYLGLRYESTAVRLLGTCVGMLQTICYMAICLLSPALALQAAAGIELWLSVVVVGIVGTIYTSLGGIKSVVWTDTFQTFIIFAGMMAILIKGLMEVGGVKKMFEIAQSQGRIILDDVSVDPRVRHTMWSLSIGAFFNWFVNSFNQSTVQRLSSLRTIKSAKIAYFLNGPLCIIYGSILCFSGVLVYSYYYTKGCDPYEGGLIDNRNQVMPYFVMEVLVSLPGMPGLYISTLFSGALSTFSSGINALAANTVEDLLGYPIAKYKATERTATLIAKAFVFFYGLLTIGLAYSAKSLHGPVTQMANSAMGACGGPVLGIFLLGAIFPWANRHGALYGCLSAIIFNLWIAIGGQIYGSAPTPLPSAPTYGCPANISMFTNITESEYTLMSSVSNMTTTVSLENNTSARERPFFLYEISYLWYGLCGVIISMLVGSVISFATGKYDVTRLESRLLFPFASKLWKMDKNKSSETNYITNLEQVSLMKVRESWAKNKESRFPENSTFILEDQTANDKDVIST